MLFVVPTLNAVDDDHNEIYFEDVNIIIIGRCRTIISSGSDPWIGGLRIGCVDSVGIDIGDTPKERLYILLKGFFMGPTNYTVFMRDVKGVFFWGAEGSGYSETPPAIFICCHVKKLWIREPGWEP